MAGDEDLTPGLHFAGVNTRLLVRYLREQEEPGAVERVLSEAGDTRTQDELADNATWSSYDQFRRLLETTARLFGGHDTLTRAAGGGLTDGSQAEMTAMLQSLGSPSALLAMITESGGAGLAPVIALEGHEVDSAEWIVREWFAEGFEPFPEYCAWAAGLYSNIPTLFGLRAQVTKEACACAGAPACEYRIRWFPDDAGVAADNFEARIQVLTARLEGLQQMVGELVSDDDLERVLTRIVVSAARSMSAPVFVLALEAMPSADKRVYSVGIGERAAERLASELLVGTRDGEENHLIVEVQSNRRRYGRLAAVNPTGRFFPHERVVFQAYARLAACRARLRGRGRGSSQSGRVGARPARAVQLARRDRDHRRDGRPHRPSGHRGHRLRPRGCDPVRAERIHRSNRGDARPLGRVGAEAPRDGNTGRPDPGRRRSRERLGSIHCGGARDVVAPHGGAGQRGGRDDRDRRQHGADRTRGR